MPLARSFPPCFWSENIPYPIIPDDFLKQSLPNACLTATLADTFLKGSGKPSIRTNRHLLIHVSIPKHSRAIPPSRVSPEILPAPPSDPFSPYFAVGRIRSRPPNSSSWGTSNAVKEPLLTDYFPSKALGKEPGGVNLLELLFKYNTQSQIYTFHNKIQNGCRNC